MQKDEMSKEGGIECDGHAEDSWEDDRCMTEDHRDDEADKDSVQSCIIKWTCVQCAKIQVDDSADAEPDESAEETDGNITGEWVGVADVTCGEVISQEPK